MNIKEIEEKIRYYEIESLSEDENQASFARSELNELKALLKTKVQVVISINELRAMLAKAEKEASNQDRPNLCTFYEISLNSQVTNKVIYHMENFANGVKL